jgi:hypothetical protein
MKKIFTLIILTSFMSFAQFESYNITEIGFSYNADIRGIENALTVPQGKVWKVISGRSVYVVEPNREPENVARSIGYHPNFTSNSVTSNFSGITFLHTMVIPSGYQVYSNTDDGVFNYIEYDLSQNLAYNVPQQSAPTLYPNPTSSLLALNSDKEYDIEVYDMAGNKVMALTGNNINMEHLSTATYIVKATDKSNNEELTYKVVKN